jgi:hypothetical protein
MEHKSYTADFKMKAVLESLQRGPKEATQAPKPGAVDSGFRFMPA